MDDNSPVVAAANPKAVLDAAKDAITSPIKKRVGAKSDQSIDMLSEPKTAKGTSPYNTTHTCVYLMPISKY